MKWLCAAVLAMSLPAVADDQTEAAKLFEEGRKLGDQGRSDEACEKFKKSYELEQAAGTALNLGECAERAGNWKQAFELYTNAAEVFDKTEKAARAKFARERAASVKRQHPDVDFKPPPTGRENEETPPPKPDEVKPTEQPAQPAIEQPSSGTGRTVAKYAAFGMIGVSVAMGVWWYTSYGELHDFGELEGFMVESGTPKTQGIVDAPDCGNVTLSPDSAQSKFEGACSAYDRLKWLPAVTLVTAGLGVGTLVYLQLTKPKRRPVAIVPTATGDAAFVTAAFEF